GHLRRQEEGTPLAADFSHAHDLPDIVDAVGRDEDPARALRGQAVQVLHPPAAIQEGMIALGRRSRLADYLAPIVDAKGRGVATTECAEIAHNTAGGEECVHGMAGRGPSHDLTLPVEPAGGASRPAQRAEIAGCAAAAQECVLRTRTCL